MNRDRPNEIKKIAIIGCGGAGKSTLSTELGNLLSLPVFHLDNIYWNPNWVPSEHDDFIKRQEDIASNNQWIMDGNYGKTMDIRLDRADTIIFLDLPSIVCLWSVIKRYFKYKNTARPDMVSGNSEHITFEFLHYVWNYRKYKQPIILKKIKNIDPSKTVVILKTRRETKTFINEISKRSIL